MCKGRGAEASSYRPNRDETQFTNRRDALVRCVAALLFGPTAPAEQERELILIHEEDFSRIEMKLENNIVPSEHNIVSQWKEAAGRANNNMDDDRKNSTCRIVLDSSVDNNTMPNNMDNKRQVLEYLQTHCSIEFLRKHRLNSNANVVLRKTNKNQLMKVYREWNAENTTETRSNKQERLASIFTEILKPQNSDVDSVVAGILHESSKAELPCFDVTPTKTSNLQVCLFLGAVRDMYMWENSVLQTCCSQQQVPLVHVRLGPVCEFTSKILSVVACHHAHNRLGPAMLQSCQKQQNNKNIQDAVNTQSRVGTRKLHVVCFVSSSSAALSSDLQLRSRQLWALVRVVVCTLWRSRLASNISTNSPLENELTIVFADGILLTFDQQELVSSLAEQHQAAPCEHQIIQALVKKRDFQLNQLRNRLDTSRAEALIDKSFQLQDSEVPTFALDVLEAGDDSLMNSLYSYEQGNKTSTKGGQLLLLLRIRNEMGGVTRHDDKNVEVFKAACENRGIPVLVESLIANNTEIQDYEAATITMLQHFIYQDRLFPVLDRLYSKQEKKRRRNKESRKTRKDHKKKKKKQS